MPNMENLTLKESYERTVNIRDRLVRGRDKLLQDFDPRNKEHIQHYEEIQNLVRLADRCCLLLKTAQRLKANESK